MKVVYIAGPYRGKTGWDVAQNVRRAEMVGHAVAQCGAMPMIPHANTAHFDGEFTEEFWLEGTMELLRRCDAVLLMDRWMHSTGAAAEAAEAQRLDIPILRQGNAEVWNDIKAWVGGRTFEEIWNTPGRVAQREAYSAKIGGG